MADGYDRFENEGGGGGFIMGLLTGTVLGAGLGMLFAPKSGTQLRNQLSEQAGNLANSASEGYRKATEAAVDLADRGRDIYGKAREAVTRGADEAQRHVREVAKGAAGSSSGPTINRASGYESEPSRGSQPIGGSPTSGPGGHADPSTGGSRRG